jgi:hypothetical protein
MKQRLQALGNLTRRQRIAVAILLAIILLTWLAACLVLVLPAG